MKGWFILAASVIHWLSLNAFAATDAGLVLGNPVCTNGQVQLPLTVEAAGKVVIERSLDLQNWTPLTTNNSPSITRVISVDAAAELGFYRASRAPRPLFLGAIATSGYIDLKGNSIRTDGFDSADPLYSTDGKYDTNKFKASGDIISSGSDTNSTISIGNANICGHVWVGPASFVTFGPNSSVGSVMWVNNNTQGIEPGWAGNDVTISFPEIALPEASWVEAPPGGMVDGGFYDHIFTNSGSYHVSDAGAIYVGTNVQVTLLVTNVPVFYPDSIYVAGDSANPGKLTAYIQSSELRVRDTFVQSELARNLMFIASSSCTNVVFLGSFTGCVYAPSAHGSISGVGVELVGATVTRAMTVAGIVHFHYDEDLKRTGPFR